MTYVAPPGLRDEDLFDAPAPKMASPKPVAAPMGFTDQDLFPQAAAPRPVAARPTPAIPAVVKPTPTPVDVSFGDRFMANFNDASNYTATGAAANLLSSTMSDRTYRTLLEWQQPEAAERYRKGLIDAEIQRRNRYANLPAWNAEGTSLWDKISGGTAALSGQFATAAISPEGFVSKLPGMFAKIMPAAERYIGKTVAPAVFKAAPRAGAIVRKTLAPVGARMAEAAAVQGTVMGALDPFVQVTDQVSGKSDVHVRDGDNVQDYTADYDPLRTVLHAMFGAALGATIHGGGEALGASIRSGSKAIGDAFMDWRINSDMARLLREQQKAQEIGPPTQEEAAAFAASPQGQALAQQFGPPQAPPIASMRDQILQPDARVPVPEVAPQPVGTETLGGAATDLRARTATAAPALRQGPAEPIKSNIDLGATYEGRQVTGNNTIIMHGRDNSKYNTKIGETTIGDKTAEIWRTGDNDKPGIPKSVDVVMPLHDYQALAGQPISVDIPNHPVVVATAKPTLTGNKLEHVVVSPELRRQGLGTKVLDELETHFGTDIFHPEDASKSGAALINKVAERRRPRPVDEPAPVSDAVAQPAPQPEAKVNITNERPVFHDESGQPGSVKITDERPVFHDEAPAPAAEAKAAPAAEAKPAAEPGKITAVDRADLPDGTVRTIYADSEGRDIGYSHHNPKTGEVTKVHVADERHRGDFGDQMRQHLSDAEGAKPPAAKPTEAPAPHIEEAAAPVVEAPAAKVAKPSHNKSQPYDAENNRFPTTETGHVANERGEPIKFSDKDQAGRWIDNANKKNPNIDQGFKIVKHPDKKRWTVVDRKAEAKAATKPTETPTVRTAEAATAGDAVTSPGEHSPAEAPVEDHAAKQAEIDAEVQRLTESGEANVEGYEHSTTQEAAAEAGPREDARPVDEGATQPSRSETSAEQPADQPASQEQPGAASSEAGGVERSGGEGVERDGGPVRDEGAIERGEQEPVGGEGEITARPEPEDLVDPEHVTEAEQATADPYADDVAAMADELEAIENQVGGTVEEKLQANADLRNLFHANPFASAATWKLFADTLVKTFGWTKELAAAAVDAAKTSYDKFEFPSPAGMKPSKVALEILRPFAKATSTIFNGKASTLRGWAIAKNSKTAKKIADLMDNYSEGVGRRVTGAKRQDYFTARSRWSVRWANRVTKSLRFVDELPRGNRLAAYEQIGKLVRNPKNIVRGTQYGDAAHEITKIFKEMHTYLREAGVDVGTVTDGYVPRIENVEAILANQAEFIRQATKAYMDSSNLYTPALADKAAREWLKRVTYGDYGLDPEGEPIGGRASSPTGNFTQKRSLSKEADVTMEKFFHQNIANILPRYIHQATARAEWARRFGPRDAGATPPQGLTLKQAMDWRLDPSGKWKDMQQEMIAEGNGHLIPTVAGIVRRMTGDFGAPAGMYAPLRGTALWLKTMNFLGSLSYSTLSSLTEPLTHAVTQGSLKPLVMAPLKTIKHWTPIINQLGDGKYWDNFIQDIGAGGDAMDNHSAIQMTGGESGSLAADHLMSGFFEVTGQSGFSHGQRRLSAELGTIWFHSLARDLQGKYFPNIARKILTDFGITDPDGFAVYLANLHDKPTVAEIEANNTHGREYSEALQRYIQRTVMHPTGAMKPFYAEHPFGSLIYSLTSFLYTFKNNVLDRSGRMFIDALDPKSGLNGYERAYSAMPVAMLVPMMIASYWLGEARDQVLPDPEQAGKKPMEEKVKMIRAASRMGAFGQLDPVANAFTQSRYKTDAATTMWGAVMGRIAKGVGNTLDIGRAEFAGEDDSTNARSRAMAGSQWDLIVRPVTQAGIVATAPLKSRFKSVRTAGKWIARAASYGLADRRVRSWFVNTKGGEKKKSGGGGGGSGMF